jgi:hypothetical protein
MADKNASLIRLTGRPLGVTTYLTLVGGAEFRQPVSEIVVLYLTGQRPSGRFAVADRKQRRSPIPCACEP